MIYIESINSEPAKISDASPNEVKGDIFFVDREVFDWLISRPKVRQITSSSWELEDYSFICAIYADPEDDELEISSGTPKMKRKNGIEPFNGIGAVSDSIALRKPKGTKVFVLDPIPREFTITSD